MLTKILAFLSSSRLPSDKHTKTIQGVKTVCEKPLPTGEPRLLARGRSLNAPTKTMAKPKRPLPSGEVAGSSAKRKLQDGEGGEKG